MVIILIIKNIFPKSRLKLSQIEWIDKIIEN